MDEADDDYHGPPLPGGQRQLQGNSQMRQQMSYSSFNSAGGAQRQPQTLQMAIEMEQELYLRRQIELQRDIQLRRALIQEHHQQFMSELESQQQLQQLQQSQFTNPLLQQQRLIELQQLGSPGRRPFSLQEEQLLLQQQQQRMMRQQQMQTQERMLHRDLQIPDPPSMPATTGRAGPGVLQERARQLLDEDVPNKEDAPKAADSSRKYSKDKPQKDKVSKDKAPKEKPVMEKVSKEKANKEKVREQEEERPRSAEPVRNQRNKRSETINKPDFQQTLNQEKRKRSGSDNLSHAPQPDKRLKEEEKTSEKEKESPKPPPRKQQSDIALLLRATEDPSVKNRSLAGLKRSTSEPDLEYQHSATRNGQKSFADDTKTGSTDHSKTSDLEALALEALRQNAKRPPSPSLDDSHSDRQIAALIANLQRSTPPPSPPLQEEKEEEEENEEENSVPDFMYSLPHLPVEPEYLELRNTEEGKGGNGKAQDEKANTDGDSGSENEAESAVLAEVRSANMKANVKLPGIEERDVKEPVIIPNLDESSNRPAVYTIPIDTWWPSNSVVKRERRLQGYRSDEEDSEKEDSGSGLMSEPAKLALKDRLENQIEPGVLQKLPHCKLHRLRSKQRRDQCPVPLFCFQVTESHCTDTMVCCSICSTWRHVTCGGHYTKCPVQSNSGTPFTPVCDRCFEEAKVLRDYPKAQRRIDRQRIEHLRRSLSTTSVIRQASLAKHGGTYKWPLGSVTNTHIGGHTRSVHSRHERSEKQWSETATKLGNGLGYRPKERAKVRTREFERILVNVEDAEGHTDRHNMMLFLQSDTEKEHPAGFEASCRNFFDPEEDPDLEPDSAEGTTDARKLSEEGPTKEADIVEGSGDVREPAGLNDNTAEGSESESDAISVESENAPMAGLEPDIEGLVKKKACNGMTGGEDGLSENDCSKEGADDESSVVTMESQGDASDEPADESGPSSAGKNSISRAKRTCARAGCRKKPRFDSLFCSDSCGVSAIERDLLHSFEYATEIHPSLLRP